MGITTNPTNQNLAQPSKFLLSFGRLPALTFFCTKVNIPGITFGSGTQPMPLPLKAPIPGNNFEFDTLKVSFIVDEQLTSWITIRDWLVGVGEPDSTDEYVNLSLQQRIKMNGVKPQYSDALITLYTNKQNPFIQYEFVDVFPIQLSSLQFDTSLSAKDVMIGSAVFKFTTYTYKRLVV